jgi:hypothetical protein
MVSYRVARTGKTHTIVEDLILPAAVDMAGTLLGEKVKKTIQTMSSSNNTVSRSISDMAGDVLKQLLLCIQTSVFYELQLNESDVADLAQLLVYVRYVYGWSIRKDILFSKPLETRTTGDDIFKVLDSFVTSKWTLVVKMCWYLY